METKDRLDRPVAQDLLEQLAQLDKSEHLELLETLGLPVYLDHRVQQDQQDHWVPLDNLDHLVQ